MPVPEVDEKYIGELIKDMKIVEPQKDDKSILLDILKLSDPKIAWSDDILKNWLINPESVDEKLLKNKVEENLKNRYNPRAKILKEQHPLGIQVNLATGVANGLLVLRNIPDCVELIKRILTRKLDFELSSQTINGNKYIFLIEKISKCVYRIVSGDKLLTNSFWNFYLENNPDEINQNINQ